MTLIATATTRFGGVSVNQLVSHYTANYSAAAVLKARSKERKWWRRAGERDRLCMRDELTFDSSLTTLTTDASIEPSSTEQIRARVRTTTMLVQNSNKLVGKIWH